MPLKFATIADATTEGDFGAVRELFVEYSGMVGINLCFQRFDEELANLPGAYAPPAGALLLARPGGEAAGCVALRPITVADAAPGERVCEMKRLYVRPAFRGQRIGEALAEAIVERARELNYHRMMLDTIPERMAAASGLYRALGFEETAPYYHNPNPGIAYFQLRLQDSP